MTCEYHGTNCDGNAKYKATLAKEDGEKFFIVKICHKCLVHLQRRVWQNKNCKLTYNDLDGKKQKTYG